MPRNAVQPLDKFFNVMSLVAIVGRPNVGKSTLFNRLVGQRQAIVDSTAGTTRDRHYGKTDWNGKEFSVIDTGGYTVNSDDIFEDDIRRQVMLAIDEADVILFLVEVSTGITDLDTLMADILRRTTKKVILVCNKVDNYDQIYSSHEFYKLGLGDPYCISSMSGSGTGDLMDAILEALPAETSAQYEDDLPRITIVGRPNVGKSSLTNALLGVERNIVTPVAGTTRDSIHTRYNKFGMDFYLVDTAGMRKKGKVTEDLEFYSVMRSIRAIENSDVCVLMLDAEQGLESQEGEQHDEGVARVPDEETGPVQRHSDHLHFGAEQTAYSGSVADGRARLPVAQAPYPHLGVQRLHPARDRGDAAALDQRQIHPYQIRHAAAYAHAAVRLLRQPAAVYQGALPPLLGEQNPRAVGFLRRPHAVVFPGEVTAGEILVSTFPPNLPLPALRAASVAAPRHPASGCAQLATRVTKGGFFPTSPCRRISGRNNSRRNPFPDIHEPSSCQKTGFAAAATSVTSTHNDTGKSEKTIRTLVFSHETPYLYPQG